MTQPTSLDKYRKDKRKRTAQGKTLCSRGFHKWTFDGKKQFDVKAGRLVSIEVCSRCGARRNHVQ